MQTAFIGDVILTLPLLQTLHSRFAASEIDAVVVPRAADLLEGHPAVASIIRYDKRGSDSGMSGFTRLVRRLRERRYDLAIVPHRSIRSALLVRAAGIPKRIGFDRSAGSFFWTDVIRYENGRHEIDRNLSLLAPVIPDIPARVLPLLYPSPGDEHAVDEAIRSEGISGPAGMIAVAPGTIWKTKQWLPSSFAALCRLLGGEGYAVVLTGGKEDVELCAEIRREAGQAGVTTLAGKLTLRQSAALMKKCRVLVSNDSAPMHLAVAMGTPVVAIFGATVPAFGFGPAGPRDLVVETLGLSCRPCSVHGGAKCPIGTFDCMLRITPERVVAEVRRLVGSS